MHKKERKKFYNRKFFIKICYLIEKVFPMSKWFTIMLRKVVEQAITNCAIESEYMAILFAPPQDFFLCVFQCVLYEVEYLEVPENFPKLIFLIVLLACKTDVHLSFYLVPCANIKKNFLCKKFLRFFLASHYKSRSLLR